MARPPPPPAARARRLVQGDWQTPDALAEAVVARVLASGRAFASVLEPTCGVGAFLAAAARALPGAALHGLDADAGYVARARRRVPGAEIVAASFWSRDWRAFLAALPEPILLLGNPPWVTRARLGALGGERPPSPPEHGLGGLDAMTGASNFDASEAMIAALLEAAVGRRFALAMLCKRAVARKLIARAGARGLRVRGAICGVDARASFGASVDAALLLVEDAAEADGPAREWSVFADTATREPQQRLGLVAGRLVPDARACAATESLARGARPAWRSGVKHDCAPVMELSRRGAGWENSRGEPVAIEPARLFPLLKGGDLARGATVPTRALIVTQSALSDDTRGLAESAPETWAYLTRNRAWFDRRRSRVYAGKPPFAMFGVGPYTFAPFKIAVSGLHKRLTFALLEPVDGRPVVLDDTCYFLPFDRRAEAEAALAALASPRARAFFEARIFWDEKRPITKRILGELSLAELQRQLFDAEASSSAPSVPHDREQRAARHPSAPRKGPP